MKLDWNTKTVHQLFLVVSIAVLLLDILVFGTYLYFDPNVPDGFDEFVCTICILGLIGSIICTIVGIVITLSDYEDRNTKKENGLLYQMYNRDKDKDLAILRKLCEDKDNRL